MRDATQRQQLILQQLRQHGQVVVDELAQQLRTSSVTIRKDLSGLEQEGKLIRRYGGAVPTQAESTELPVANEQVSKRKLAIAEKALELIPDGARILLDGGSTVGALLPLLAKRQGLVIMTNSPQAAAQLCELHSEPTVLMTGGTWDATSRSLQGRMAERVLREYDFDLAFVGAAGLDIERGSTTYNELTGLTQVMAEVAARVVLLSASDKLDKRMPNVELGWEKIDVLVTDEQMPLTAQQQIKNQQVEVLIAAAIADS